MLLLLFTANFPFCFSLPFLFLFVLFGIWLLNKKLACCSSEMFSEKEDEAGEHWKKERRVQYVFILVVVLVARLIEIFRRFSQIFHEISPAATERKREREIGGWDRSLVTKSASIPMSSLSSSWQISWLHHWRWLTLAAAKSSPQNKIKKRANERSKMFSVRALLSISIFISTFFYQTMTTTLSARGAKSIN